MTWGNIGVDWGRVLVTGGSGSVGQAFIDRMLKSNENFETITILSRDECKQHELQVGKYANETKLKWVVGDVRDRYVVRDAVMHHKTIVHAAALKHVPACERYPEEAVKTNILSAMNIVNSIKEHPRSVRRVVGCSTDKASDPTTAMGCSKLMMEKIFMAAAENGVGEFRCVRYGNMFESRGSVLHLFMDKARAGEPLPLTDERMTRFVSTLEDAADTIIYAVKSGFHRMTPSLVIKDCPAVRMKSVAEVVWKYYNGEEPVKIEHIGCRPSEKLHESLFNRDHFGTIEFDEDYYTMTPNIVVTDPMLLTSFELRDSSESLMAEEDEKEFIIKMIKSVEDREKEKNY